MKSSLPVPGTLLSTPVDGPAKGISTAAHWDGMLDNYYRLMGWDRQTGKPFPATLRALGLDSVVADLWTDTTVRVNYRGVSLFIFSYRIDEILFPLIEIVSEIRFR